MKINYSIHKVNGYTVILVPNDTNTVRINACIKTGTLDENKHDAGIHHLVEHILTESWKPCGKDTCNSYWDKKGVIMNASTHFTYMKFYVNGLVEDMEEMMQYMMEIITKPFLQLSTLKIEKHAVLNELLQRLNDPENKLYHAFNTEFFKESHSADYDLQIKNLKQMTMKRVEDFYKNINKEIIFVISGPNKMPNFKENFHFKEIKKDFFSYKNKIVYVPYKQKSTILLIGIPLQVESHKINACIIVLHMLLFQLLRVKMKMVYSIQIQYNELPGPHIILKSTIENKHTNIVYNTIVESIEKYTKVPFPQKFIDGMKKKYKLHYETINYDSNFMANYVLDEYLISNEIVSLETKYKEIIKLTQKDYMKMMKMINNCMKNCIVAYQGPIKLL
jgi:hypothetical protein